MVSRADRGDPLRVTAAPAAALAGRARVLAADHGVQEGARQFVIEPGPGGGAVELSSTEPLDLSREPNGDVLVLATLRLDARPSAPVFLAARCEGAGCEGPVRIGEFASLPLGSWQVLAVPLKCFAAAGADMTRVLAPFRLVTDGSLKVTLARVALGSASEADEVARCPVG